MNAKRGKGLVVTGISGGGKTTLAEIILRRHPELSQSLRMTIREPRQGEIHGVHYEFVTSEEMVRLWENNELLYYKEWYGSVYAMRVIEVEDKLSNGENILIETIVPAAFELAAREDMQVVFLVTENEEVQIQRLRKRGETEEKIQNRLEHARVERRMADELNIFTVVNDQIETTVAEIEKYFFDKS
jgi:guanylate kinase